MWVLPGFVVAAIIGLTIVLVLSRGREARLESHPWIIEEVAKLHVQILGGLAGFAFTGIVLIVTFAQQQAGSTDPALDTVIVMFLVAFLWWIGGAFLISLLPHKETSGDLVPRVHFSLATTLEYRTVFLSWFALVPLLQANGLGRLAPIAEFLLLGSMACGSVLVAMVADGLGLLRFKETYLSACVGLALAIAYAGISWLVSTKAGSPYTAMFVTLVVFVLNGLGFSLACLTPLAPRYPGVRRFFERYGRQIVVADMQLTMASLAFLSFSVVGIF